MPTRLLSVLWLTLLPAGLSAQTATVALDSTAELPSRTQVRVRVLGADTTWQVGQIGRWLPSQCVFVIVTPVAEPSAEPVTIYAAHLARLEVWRTVATGEALLRGPNGRHDAEWAPYSLAALRRHEIAAGCANPEREHAKDVAPGA